MWQQVSVYIHYFLCYNSDHIAYIPMSKFVVWYYWRATFNRIFYIIIHLSRAFESLQIMSKYIFLLQFETHLLSSFDMLCIVVGTFDIMQMSKN